MYKLNEIIGDAKTVAIVGHIRPDGDCIGSALGIYNYILDNFKEVEVRVNLMKPLPTTFKFMRGYDKITWEAEPDKVYDLCICVDCGSIDRIEGSEAYFKNAKRTFCVDHHKSNAGNFADELYLEATASSTCELVYDLLDPEKVSKECAECLYSGIVTDSGLFKFNSTSEKTMNTAGKLMATGIDFPAIVDKVFYEKTYNQNRIMGHVLTNSVLICNNQCIVGVVNKEDMEFFDVEPRHLDGIVNQLLNTRDIEVALFIYELDNLCYKVSLRSKTFIDVSEIVKVYDGGGHKHAAGCTIHGTSHDVINAVSKYINDQLKEMTTDV